MPDVFINPNKTNEKNPQDAEEVAEETAAKADAFLPPNLKVAGPTPIHGFSTYKEMPEGVTFDTQEDDETILLFLRRDFITNVPWIVGTVILIIAPFLLGFVIQFSGSPFTFFSSQFMLTIGVFYYLIVAAYVFVNFITWYFNVSL